MDNRLTRKAYIENYEPQAPQLRHISPIVHSLNEDVVAQRSISTLKELDSYYSLQIQRLNEQLRDFQTHLSQRNHENDLYRVELQERRKENANQTVLIRQLRQSLQNVIALNEQKQIQIDSLRQSLQLQQLQSNQTLKLQYNDNMNQLILQRDMAQNQLIQLQQNYQYQNKLQLSQLTEKSREIQDLKRKYAEVLEAKRRDDEELKGVRWGAQMARDKLSCEVRQLKIKIQNQERSFFQAMQNKILECTVMENKTAMARQDLEQAIQQRDSYYQDRQRFRYQLQTLRRDSRNARNDLFNERGPERRQEGQLPRADHQRQDSKQDSRHNFQRGQKSVGRPPRPQSRQQWKARDQKENRKQNRDREARLQYSEDSDNRNPSSQSRHKFEQISAAAGMAIKKEFEGQASQGPRNQPTSRAIEKSEMKGVVEKSRKSIVEHAFKLFCSSVDSANIKKQNSLILFMLNLKEQRSKADVIISSIENYKEIAKTVAKPQLTKETRDSVNAWVQGTIAFTIEQKRKNSRQKNQLFLYLFRLLAIKYRVMYPLKDKKPVRLDSDLEEYLQHKIVTAVRLVLKHGEA